MNESTKRKNTCKFERKILYQTMLISARASLPLLVWCLMQILNCQFIPNGCDTKKKQKQSCTLNITFLQWEKNHTKFTLLVLQQQIKIALKYTCFRKLDWNWFTEHAVNPLEFKWYLVTFLICKKIRETVLREFRMTTLSSSLVLTFINYLSIVRTCGPPPAHILHSRRSISFLSFLPLRTLHFEVLEFPLFHFSQQHPFLL